MKKNVIITGGSGFIGHNLCQRLHDDVWTEWNIFVVDDLSSGYKTNRVPGVSYIYESILKPGLMDKLVKDVYPDVIFHFAAVPRVSFSVLHPVETADANVMGTMKVLDAIRKNKSTARLINSSSSSVYGGADVMPTPETHLPDPKSPYALDKLQSEQWCKMYASLYDLDVVSLRYFNVFGPYSRYGGAYSTVLSAWLYSLFVDTSVKPFLEGDGLQSRDFCYVDNVVAANKLAAESSKKFQGESFNIAQGDNHSLLDCKDILERISGKKLDLEIRAPRTGDVRHTLADITKAKEILGYNPTNDFEKQVEQMAEWYKIGYK